MYTHTHTNIQYSPSPALWNLDPESSWLSLVREEVLEGEAEVEKEVEAGRRPGAHARFHEVSESLKVMWRKKVINWNGKRMKNKKIDSWVRGKTNKIWLDYIYRHSTHAHKHTPPHIHAPLTHPHTHTRTPTHIDTFPKHTHIRTLTNTNTHTHTHTNKNTARCLL